MSMSMLTAKHRRFPQLLIVFQTLRVFYSALTLTTSRRDYCCKENTEDTV